LGPYCNHVNEEAATHEGAVEEAAITSGTQCHLFLRPNSQARAFLAKTLGLMKATSIPEWVKKEKHPSARTFPRKAVSTSVLATAFSAAAFTCSALLFSFLLLLQQCIDFFQLWPEKFQFLLGIPSLIPSEFFPQLHFKELYLLFSRLFPLL